MPSIARRLATALALVTLAATSGCGGSDLPATLDESATPVEGGHLVWGVTTEPVCFDPHRATQTNAYFLARNYVDSLVSKREDGTFAPWLATRWTISPDGRTYTFWLRDDVRFTDGVPFDAAAVKANLDDIADPKKAQNSLAYLQSYERSTVLDPHRIQIRLSQPDSTLLESLSSVQLGMLSPRSLARGDALCGGGKALAGTGPFAFETYRRGQSVTLARNDAYAWPPAWADHSGPAYLDRVTFKFLPENVVRTGALSSGQVDVIEAVQPTDVSAFDGEPGFQYLTGPSSNTAFTLNLNYTRGLLRDVRIRRAIRDGFDLDEVVKSLYLGTMPRAWSNIGPDDADSATELEGTWGNDVDAANAALDAAGWTGRDDEGFRTKDGHRLTIEVGFPDVYIRDYRDVLIQGIQSELKRTTGIDLSLRILTLGEFTAQENNGTWTIYPNTMNPGDTAMMLTQLTGQHGFLYDATTGGDQRLFADLERALRETDPAKRHEQLVSIQKYLIDQAYVVPLYAPKGQLAATTLVHGLGFDPNLDTPASAYDLWKERS